MVEEREAHCQWHWQQLLQVAFPLFPTTACPGPGPALLPPCRFRFKNINRSSVIQFSMWHRRLLRADVLIGVAELTAASIFEAASRMEAQDLYLPIYSPASQVPLGVIHVIGRLQTGIPTQLLTMPKQQWMQQMQQQQMQGQGVPVPGPCRPLGRPLAVSF